MRVEPAGVEECPHVVVRQRVAEAEKRVHRVGGRAARAALEGKAGRFDQPAQRAEKCSGSGPFVAAKRLERIGLRETSTGPLESSARGAYLVVAGMAAEKGVAVPEPGVDEGTGHLKPRLRLPCALELAVEQVRIGGGAPASCP